MTPFRFLLLLSGVLAAAPLAAEPLPDLLTAPLPDPLSAEDFDARTRGRTITYSAFGQPYGVEQYLPGRQVVWAFEGSACKRGTWFQHDRMICFDYRDDSGLQCWTFHDTKAGLIARFMGDATGEPLISLQESTEPLICPGPDVGV